jgi:hypothetical protein
VDVALVGLAVLRWRTPQTRHDGKIVWGSLSFLLLTSPWVHGMISEFNLGIE